jgi:hypothetical protein
MGDDMNKYSATSFLVLQALNAGCVISIADAEGLIQSKSASMPEIMSAIRSVDEGYIRVWKHDDTEDKFVKIGYALFVNGVSPVCVWINCGSIRTNCRLHRRIC